MKKIFTSLLLVGAVVALVGCSGNTKSANDTKKSDTTTSSAPSTVSVTDSQGDKVKVNYQPKKVVVFDNSMLDTMDALGVGKSVVGAPTKNLPTYLKQYKEVASAGGIKEPDLEKVNQMKPDLIIISGRQADFKKDLSAIAPTIFLGVDNNNTWKSIESNINTIAQIFGKQAEAKKQLGELNTSIASLKEKAKATGGKTLVTLVSEGSLSAFGEGSRFSIVYDTFGFDQADTTIKKSTHGQSVSYEYVLEKNPDILFVVDRTKAIGGDASKDNVAANDLVKETNAAKNNKVISLEPDVWYLAGSGLESLKLMMNDVSQAFK